jgi:hypothetical protein
MQRLAFNSTLAGIAAVSAGALWLAAFHLLGLPTLPLGLMAGHAIVIFGHAVLLRDKVPNHITRGSFLLRIGFLYALTTTAMFIGYFECRKQIRDAEPARGTAAESEASPTDGEQIPRTVAFWAGVIAWGVVRLVLFPAKPKRKRPVPNYGTNLRTGAEALELAAKALPPGDSGLEHGGVPIASLLGRLGTLMVGSIGAGKTTLLRLLLQGAMALSGIRPPRGLEPGSDCRAWVLDVKREMVPIIMGIVGDNCPVLIMTPTDLRSCKWNIAADIQDDATCLQFAKIFVPDEPGQNPFWPNAVQTLVFATLIYLTRSKSRWDLRDLALILEDEELTGQVVDAVRDNQYVRQLWEPKVTWQSIRVTLAVKLTELRLIAAMWDHCHREVSLDWWTKNEAVLVLGTDPSVDATLKVLVRMMFKRTTELLLARGTDRSGRRFNWLVLDELPALEHLPGLSEICLRGRAGGTNVLATVQSIADVRHFFKTQAAGLLGQFFNRAFLRTDDPETAVWMEQCTGQYEAKEWFENAGSSHGPGGRSVNQGWSQQRVSRPAFSREDFMNMAPASSATGIPGVFKSYLGETALDDLGQVRNIVTTWYDALACDATFGKLIPADPNTPDFLPRPPEHQQLRPFGIDDCMRLKLRPKLKLRKRA